MYYGGYIHGVFVTIGVDSGEEGISKVKGEKKGGRGREREREKEREKLSETPVMYWGSSYRS